MRQRSNCRGTAHVTDIARPAFPRRLAAAGVAFALCIAGLVTGVATAHPAGASVSAESTITAKLNGARAARGIARLSVRSALVDVARAQARRMAVRSELYHNPNLTRDVKNWRVVGENVGYGPSAGTVHVAFMHSAPHRANILDRSYTQVGIGAVVRGGRVWVAEVFRRPMHTAAHWTHVLRYGSTGAAVTRVQRRLGVHATGWYGKSTRRAVRHFQRSLGWAGRGKVGRGTWRHLF